jgi:deoxyribose-phosphate aldolase
MKNINEKKEPRQLASYIQFTKISPALTKSQAVNHINLCKKYNFNAAMIAPCWVPLAKEMLENTSVKTASFIDFGMGSASVSGKVALIKDLINCGAEEVDYAPNMGFFLSGMYDEFFNEAHDLVAAANGMPIKAMLQLGMIEEVSEKKRAIELLEKAGVDWIKNSSGGWPPGATNANVEDIKLIKETISGKSRVKASGGIHDYETAMALINAGAELLGTSAGLQIIGVSEDEAKSSSLY